MMTIKEIDLKPNPNYIGKKLWGKRLKSMINKIIVHQELGEANTIAVHNYHISKESHLKLGTGAPRIAYHFTIEKDGTIYRVNDETDIVWHTAGQNMSGIGVMLVGDFSGKGHVGKSEPTDEQLESLEWLLDKLSTDLKVSKSEIYGHEDFGKPACPGYKVMEFIKEYRSA